MKTTAEIRMDRMQGRLQSLQKLCSNQEKLIELLQAQLKHKEQMLAASDEVIKEIIRSRQQEEQT